MSVTIDDQLNLPARLPRSTFDFRGLLIIRCEPQHEGRYRAPTGSGASFLRSAGEVQWRGLTGSSVSVARVATQP